MYQEIAKERMDKAIKNLESDLLVLRTGRANPNMISNVMIDYYGEMTPINQLAQISVVEGRQLVVKLYDPSQLRNVEKAINAANLGLNAQNDGTVVRMLVPALTGETRKQLAKEVSKFAEEAKVAIRNIRRDVNEDVKKDEEFSEDVERRELEKIQKTTDEYIKKVDLISEEKVAEIMTV
ncbi:MAG: ribosome recycling factor [Erysipelothrix sp.]|nr:ribosome recycling factor [Erysipelothrix sp.]